MQAFCELGHANLVSVSLQLLTLFKFIDSACKLLDRLLQLPDLCLEPRCTNFNRGVHDLHSLLD